MQEIQHLQKVRKRVLSCQFLTQKSLVVELALPVSKISTSKKRPAPKKEMFSSKKVAKKDTPAPAAATSSSKFDPKAVDALYESLMDPEDPDMLSMEGISKLCESLDLDPAADVRVLVLLWKLGATSKPGNVTKSEFSAGLQKLQASSVEKLKTLIPTLDPGFLDRAEFRGKLASLS